MKIFFIILNIIFITIFFTGCEIDSIFKPSKQEIALQEKELDAKIEQNRETLKVKKDIELAKINSQLEKDKLQTQNKEKENSYKLQLQENESSLTLQKYIIFLIALIVVVTAIALYIYFNNRRKDKLKTYEDNLDKYFKSKENQTKVQIANKIIETIATGQLNPDQENRLISNISGDTKNSTKELKNIKEEEHIVDLEIIEEKKKDKKEKKKSKNKDKIKDKTKDKKNNSSKKEKKKTKDK